MTYGRNPNSVPLGGIGRTNVPLIPSAKVIKHPMPERKTVEDDEDTSSDYGSVDPNYMDDGTTESSDGQKGGIWQSLVGTPAQPGDEQIDLIEGDPSQDDIIFGTDEGGTNGISNDTIEGDADFDSAAPSDEDWDKVIFGEDGGELDAAIEGKDEEGMSDEEMNNIIYGTPDEPDEPEPPKIKKIVYRVSKQKNIPQQRQTNSGLGMVQ